MTTATSKGIAIVRFTLEFDSIDYPGVEPEEMHTELQELLGRIQEILDAETDDYTVEVETMDNLDVVAEPDEDEEGPDLSNIIGTEDEDGQITGEDDEETSDKTDDEEEEDDWRQGHNG